MIIPSGNGIISNRQTTSGRMESSGTQNATRVISTAMDFAQKWKQEKDETQYQEAINTALKKKNEWKAQNLTREGKAAEGITEEFLDFNKNLEEEIGSNLSNNAKAKFSQWQTRDTEQEKLGVMLHQRKQDMYVKQATFKEGLAISEEAIRLDAKGNWRKATEHADMTLQHGLNAGVINPEEFETKRIELHNKLRTETARSYYGQDKHDFMKNGINELGLGETEKAYWQEKYQKDVEGEEREKKTLFREEASLIMSKVDDMDTQAVVHKNTSHFHENAAKLDSMGFGEYATKLREKAIVYDGVISFNESQKGKTLAEEAEAIQSLQVSEDPDGSSLEYKTNLAIRKEYLKKQEQFNEDPAEYVKSRAVGGSMEDVAETRLSLQEGQGIVPKTGFQILTKQEKQVALTTWKTGDLKSRTGLISNLMKYGKHSPKVLKELGINSALTLAPLIARNEMDLEDLVVGVSSDKNPVLLDDKTIADYKLSARKSKVFKILANAQKLAPRNEGFDKNIADMEKAIVGMSAKKGSPEAGVNFIDSKLSTLDSGDKTIFFPADIDEDELEDLLDRKKKEFKNSMPDSRVGDGEWVNSSSGMMLLDKFTGLPVPGANIDYSSLKKSLTEVKAAATVKAARENKTYRPTIYGPSKL